MGSPLIIIGMVALLVVALLGLMASRRKRQANAD
jgi:LPXTG-motif cell wall-anchored protein